MFKKEILKDIAEKEKVSLSLLTRSLKSGQIAILANNRRKIKRPCAVGDGLKVKINTNIGTSTEVKSVNNELKKLKVAVAAGTDTIMDLSVGPNIKRTLAKIINNCPLPIGTVPIYQAAAAAQMRHKSIKRMTFACIQEAMEEQARLGVDFFTIHAGILRNATRYIRRRKRTGGIVSRGGAILAYWMQANNSQNPFYENFDKVLVIAKKYNITISLGDALRPGAIADSSDKLQIEELKVLGELVKSCRKHNVQVIVEGPGHIRLDEIAANMFLQKKICARAPFYVLGPLPTDIAAGYDHISSAIGGAIAALAGANFLCVVTPSEHLGHPSCDDIHQGVIASRIAAHAVDLLRFKDEWQKDCRLSLHRSRRHWDKVFPLTLDPQTARKRHDKKRSSEDICAMCGEYCSLKMMEKCDLLI